MSSDAVEIARKAVKGAAAGGSVSAAGAIASGAAMATTTATKWLILTTVATSVSWPAVAAFAVGGAVVGGTVCAYKARREIARVNEMFANTTRR